MANHNLNTNSFGSVDWAKEYGLDNLRKIIDLRNTKGPKNRYKKARQFVDYYHDKRRSHGLAKRAIAVLERIGKPKPYYVADNVVYSLDFLDTIKNKKPVYYPMCQNNI